MTRIHRRKSATILGVLLAAFIAGQALASTKMSAWVTIGANTVITRTACSFTGAIRFQEYGRSGVTRFRAEFQLRAPYDPGPRYGIGLPTFGKAGWWYSNSFPNDYRNYWGAFILGRGWLNSFGFSDKALWAKVVGERPSFWQRDIVVYVKLGTDACGGFGT